MISKEHKFIFIHIPKTGGNSIQNILRHYSEDVVKVYDKTVPEIEALLQTQAEVKISDPGAARLSGDAAGHTVTVTDTDLLDDIGVYNEVLQTGKHSPLSDYARHWDASVFGAFGDYYKFSIIRNPWERLISYYWSPCFNLTAWNREVFKSAIARMTPDFEYFEVQGRFEMDHLIRFDDLQHGFDEVCEALGLPKRALPVTNQSKRKHYSEYYDDELRGMVADRFRREIEYFEFEFGD